MAHLGPFNARIKGPDDPFQRDAKCLVCPANENYSRQTTGPTRNPLLAQLDGRVRDLDMLRWAVVLSASPHGMPAVAVAYLAFVYYYATRASAAWCSAYAKRFAVNVRPAVEALFPKFGDVIIARAVAEPTPFSFRAGKRDGRPCSKVLADIIGLKRDVILPEDGTNIVTYVEITEFAVPLFRGYLQQIIENVGCAEAIGFACNSSVQPWFGDPTLTEAEKRRRRNNARKAGMSAVLQPLIGLSGDVKRAHGSILWTPILQIRAPPCPSAPDLRLLQLIKTAQLCRACTPKKGHRGILPGMDGMTVHILKRILAAGRAQYGADSPHKVMWMARISGLTTVGLGDTGAMFIVLGDVVLTTAFAHVMTLLVRKRLHIDLYPTSSRSAVTKASAISPFKYEWQTLNSFPVVTGAGAEVRINRAESVSWEFIYLAAERGAKRIRLIGMTAIDSTEPVWNALVSGEFKDLVGNRVVVHDTLLSSKYTSKADVHEAVRKEATDVAVAKHVLPETIPVLCRLRGTALPTRPRYIATASATMEALRQELGLVGTCKRHADLPASSASEGGAKRARFGE